MSVRAVVIPDPQGVRVLAAGRAAVAPGGRQPVGAGGEAAVARPAAGRDVPPLEEVEKVSTNEVLLMCPIMASTDSGRAHHRPDRLDLRSEIFRFHDGFADFLLTSWKP
jgi:hypothetical protein